MRITKDASATAWEAALVPVLCSALLLAAGAANAAGETQQTGQQTVEAQSAPSGGRSEQGVAPSLPDAYKLSNWIGKPVENSAGDRLGKVAELVMDDFGVVRYVILEPEAQGAGGQNRLAIPLGHFLYPAGQEQQAAVVLDVSPEQIAQAPAFASSAWPNMGDEQWSTLVITYWLPEEVAAQRQAQRQAQQQGQQGQQARAEEPGATPFAANRDMIYLPEQKEQLFSRLDEDGDASIEREEAQSYEPVAEQFDQLDTYGNGRVTRSEFAAFEPSESPQSAPQAGQQPTTPGAPPPGSYQQ